MAQQLDEHCGASPAVDGDYVYFRGGNAGGLYRRRKDGSGGAQQLDEHCGDSPVVAGKHVYYLGTSSGDALYRRTVDGIGASQPLDVTAARSPWVDGGYVYFCGGSGRNALYRALLPSLDPDAFREWMKARWPTINNLPLWQIVLPGAHDAGTWDSSKVGLEAALAVAQGSGVAGQLRYGIRYFDLRFTPPPSSSVRRDLSQYHIYHGIAVLGNTAATVIQDVKDFLTSTELEIVILELTLSLPGKVLGIETYEPLKAEDEKWFANSVLDLLDRKMIVSHSMVKKLGHNQPAACTPMQLLSGFGGTPPRVILRWWSPQRESLSDLEDYLWWGDAAALSSEGSEHQDLLKSDGGNYGTANDTNQLKEGRDRDLASWARAWACKQTPALTHWWRLGVHTTSESLYKGANESLPKVLEWLRNDAEWGKSAWNIVAADLFTEDQYLRFVEAVIARNGRHQYTAKWRKAALLSAGQFLGAGHYLLVSVSERQRNGGWMAG